MSATTERPNIIPWPPIIYLTAAAAAIVLSYLVSLPWFPSPLSDFAFAAGLVTIAGAIAIEISAVRALKRGKTTIMPHRRSDHLVTDGSFAFSRNPIYLGNTMLLVGIGLVFGLLWFLFAAAIAVLATNKLAIEREEAHLETHFSRAFRDYRKKVRRWI